MSLLVAIDAYNPSSWKGRPTNNYLATSTWGQANSVGRSDKKPFASNSHSSSGQLASDVNWYVGPIINIPELPVEDCNIFYVEDSNPDDYSRWSPHAGFDIDELDTLDVTHVLSCYVYIPPGTTVGNSTHSSVTQNSTGADWHTQNSTASSAVYNSQYNYWNFTADINQTKVLANTSTRGSWQRIHVPFVPKSTIRDQESDSPRIDKLGGYLRPNLVGQSNYNYLYIAASQLEKGSVPSPYIRGERSNTESILDLSSYKRTVTATSLTYGSNGKWEFTNTSNDKITIDNNNNDLHPDGDFSVEWWFYCDSSQNNPYPRVFDKGNPLCHIGQTFPTYVAFNKTIAGSTLRQTTASSPINHSTWYHIVFTYNGRYAKIYIDGVLVVDKDWTTVEYLSSSGIGTDMTIGGNSGTSRSFNGKIEMFKFYKDEILSVAEVKQSYLRGRGRYL
jgi:hypothetical protein